MSYPGPITPKPFETQNLHDDDGDIIASYDIEIEAPPNLAEATQPITPTPTTTPTKFTRILTRSLTLQPTWGSTMLYPSDPNRKNLTIKVTSLGTDGTGTTPFATDGVHMTSDVGELNNAGIINHGQTFTDSVADHNGPIYLLPYGNGANGISQGPVRVDAWSVTI